MIPGYPEYVQHCLTSASTPTSWCGAEVPKGDKQVFISAHHALESLGGNKQLCPDCAEAMKGRLAQVTYQRQTASIMDRRLRPDRAPHPDGVPYASSDALEQELDS